MNKESLCLWCGVESTADCELSIEDANDMLKAVRNDDLNRLKFFITQEEKSPNIHDVNGYTALHIAVIEERIDIVEYLLMLPNINLEQRTQAYETPLLLSVELNNPEIAKMLIKRGANLKALNCNGDTILHRAISENSLEIVRFILTEGFDVNLTNNYGKTPLHLAVNKSDFELVSMLLYYNADTNILDDGGFTPFMRSLYFTCDINIQKELFKYECDYNRETYYCGNTLSLAVWCGSPLIINLIENGAGINDFRTLSMTLERCDSEIFFRLFPLITSSMLTEFEEESIFNSLLECDYTKEKWLKVLFLILKSDLLSELIDHHYKLTKQNGLFANFAKAFREKNISEDEFIKFVDICLCSGANVMFEDIEIVYEIYSNNKALSRLLNMKIENLPNFGYSLPYIFCSFGKNFASALDKYYKNDYCADLGTSPVPKLLELSRNKAVVGICTRYDINSSDWYYYIVRRLKRLNIIPEIIYVLLTFRCLIK